MASRFLLLALSLAFCSAKAQFIVQPGTVLAVVNNPDIVINSGGNVVFGDLNFDLSNANVVVALTGTNGWTLTHS